MFNSIELASKDINHSCVIPQSPPTPATETLLSMEGVMAGCRDGLTSGRITHAIPTPTLVAQTQETGSSRLTSAAHAVPFKFSNNIPEKKKTLYRNLLLLMNFSPNDCL